MVSRLQNSIILNNFEGLNTKIMLKLLNTNLQNKTLISEIDLLALSEKVVSRYVAAKTIPLKDKEDVQMAMVEKFLLKQELIKKSFKGDSKVSTYCIAVLNRMCCEVIRSELKHWKNQLIETEDKSSTSILKTSEQLLINDEKALLQKIFILLGNECYKTIVFLAYYYKLFPKEFEVQQYDKNYIENKLIELLSNNESNTKGEIFNILSKTVNLVEGKEVKHDAVRMWLNKNIDIVIARLNGPFNRTSYDKESLQILFEYYYFEEDVREGKVF